MKIRYPGKTKWTREQEATILRESQKVIQAMEKADIDSVVKKNKRHGTIGGVEIVFKFKLNSKQNRIQVLMNFCPFFNPPTETILKELGWKPYTYGYYKAIR